MPCQETRATCVASPLTPSLVYSELVWAHTPCVIQLSSHFVLSRSVNLNTSETYSMPQSHADIDNDGCGGEDDDNNDTSNGNRLTISSFEQINDNDAKDAKIDLRFTFSTLNILC